jgi:predicted negative regulator of RcsB-dependent stress response
MATQLDLQEQEQIDALKAFWNQYGNLITWTLILALGAFAAWNGWNWYQREQATKAGAMYDELERAAQAGDVEKTARVFADLRERYPRTTYAVQAGLLAAKTAAEKGKPDEARSALAWVGEHAAEDEYKTVARLRLAGLDLDAKKFDAAIAALEAANAPGFEALAADRRGDVLQAMGNKEGAVAAWRKAYDALPATADYRRLVEAKLTAAGASPTAVAGADRAVAAAASVPAAAPSVAAAPASGASK